MRSSITRCTGLATLILAAGASAQTITDADQATSVALRQDAAAKSAMTRESTKMKISGQLQFRYQANFRDDAGLATPDNDTTIGFTSRRSKITTSVEVTSAISAEIQFAFDRKTGLAMLEIAEIEWELDDDFTLRIGQFKSPLLREELMSSKRQLASERSAVNETFNQDFSQGIELDYANDKWRGAIMISDGFNTDNTAFNSAKESDIAITGRAEILLGEASFKQFKQFTSFRGATQGAMLGLAGHWQSMGDTNPSAATSTDMTTLTADLSFVGNGWNAYAAGIWRNMDVSAATSSDDFGLVVQGGVFVSDQDELFARYDGFYPDDDAGATDFNTITVGWNRYFIPESHAAKFTLDLTYHFDAVTGSGIATSDGHNLLADVNDGQIGIIAQMQILF